MGKGDKKSRRGKINSGTFGVRRPHKSVHFEKPVVNEPVLVKEPILANKKSPKTKQ